MYLTLTASRLHHTSQQVTGSLHLSASARYKIQVALPYAYNVSNTALVAEQELHSVANGDYTGLLLLFLLFTSEAQAAPRLLHAASPKRAVGTSPATR
ncbi:hypothetical protein O3P69_004238 [Scylla paramamosain]|uniref:Uncharacterized protein n=1 Tax=Scylla paramamosain TaxID=85552 RepID=A0AAW0UGP8_SCYPA